MRSPSVKIFVFAIAALSCVLPFLSRAASDSLSLTITPPFFELNVSPGDAWASSIKVVNTNPSAIQVYGSVMGFMPSGEEGHGTFINLSSLANDADALANWITASKDPISVPSGGSAEIPFSVLVPKDASPGGHYAAILIGTEPSAPGAGGSRVGIGSFISSLIFVRVSGDIKEEGSVSEFSASKETYSDPVVPFTLKFQNTGNVHLHPVGEIEIYNAFGKERGKVDLNQTNLGYVLPSSARKFDFEWRGDLSWFDIGPYTAVATLAYGENGSKSVSRTTAFWILPVGRMLVVSLVTIFFLAVLIFAIRKYVKRALAMEMAKYGGIPGDSPKQEGEHLSFRALEAPVREGIVDLRKAYRRAKDPRARFNPQAFSGFLKKYILFGIVFVLLVLGVIWAALYIRALSANNVDFQIKTAVGGASQ